MGNSRMTDRDWTTYSTLSSTRYAEHMSVQESFTQRGIHKDLDPKLIKVRESRNSEANPQATPIILALDDTGSMGYIAKDIAGQQFGVMMRAIFDRVPVSDPHIMFMAVGDATCDQAPLQASQFEADIRIIEQLGNLWMEGRGGGNMFESYNLPWHFAAFKTSCDAFEKDGRKGFLFTMGDEGVPYNLSQYDLDKTYGPSHGFQPISNAALLEKVRENYHVFHLRINQGNGYLPTQDVEWKILLGNNVLSVSNYKHLAEIIVSAMLITGGANATKVIESWQDEHVRKSVGVALAQFVDEDHDGVEQEIEAERGPQGLLF